MVLAVVLAGGRSERMRRPKQALHVAGRSLLQLAVDACAAADRIAVVAPDGPAAEWIESDPRVVVTLEDPPDGGPVAGIAAGLAALQASGLDPVLVLACDLPQVEIIVDSLLREVQAGALTRHQAVVPVDSHGWPQWLAACYRADALLAALEAAPATRDLSVRRVLGALDFQPVSLPDQVLADVDTPEQARAAGIDV
ncbi:molybdenum cofactor guanylyltransferase [Luteococcus sp. Sow4_B9]|uniref:molybdenum cofactor guanylyltransferase n=1 Tax=Luteococcus sp. Sow4_B9 TaxID=3438792 RepID=UPI003F9466D3